MTNFTKKQKAEAQFHIGKNQARLVNESRPIREKLFPKSERKRKRHLSDAAAKNMIEGTIKKNKLKAIPKPPAKEKK